MRHHWHRVTITTLSVCCLAAARSSAAAQVPVKKAERGRSYTAADVRFMQGMIHHHAQAVVMAAMAPSHGANPQVSRFCKKVILSQRDEIVLMREWLKDRGETAPNPEAMAAHATMAMEMPMADSSTMMPGMLSAEQMRRLDAARGTEFDRLFLTYMIQHHRGALTMVATLFDTPGSGQGPEIFGYATGVDADQRAEIERMQDMLATLPSRAPQ